VHAETTDLFVASNGRTLIEQISQVNAENHYDYESLGHNAERIKQRGLPSFAVTPFHQRGQRGSALRV
jgi:hypothetical protein